MLGYRGTDDANRQSAIYLAAYNSVDSTLQAPLFCHYKGINDFNLSNHKYTWFAANGNQIRGNVLIESGQSVTDYIDENMTEGKSAYVHIAYANSADGSTDFTKTNNGESYKYMGICSNDTESDELLTASDYTWSSIEGEAAEYYKLIPITETARVSKDKVLGIGLSYTIVKVKGTTVTTVTPERRGIRVRFRGDTETTFKILSLDDNPSYSNEAYQVNYNSQENPVTSLVVQLWNNDITLDQRIVPVVMDSVAMLNITDEIEATVSNNSGDISTLKQTASSLESRVSKLDYTNLISHDKFDFNNSDGQSA